MFEFLEPFHYILITGPQRSGTTIAANMIAEDLDYDLYYDGNVTSNLGKWPGEFHIQEFIDLYHSDREIVKARPYTRRSDRFVLQCPAFCRFVHHWKDVDGLAVVMMIRPVEDIIASQERIGWGFEEQERELYDGAQGPIAQVKYNLWPTQKKILGERAFELEYESLSGHTMWVPKEMRAEFTSRQIRPREPRGVRKQL